MIHARRKLAKTRIATAAALVFTSMGVGTVGSAIRAFATATIPLPISVLQQQSGHASGVTFSNASVITTSAAGPFGFPASEGNSVTFSFADVLTNAGVPANVDSETSTPPGTGAAGAAGYLVAFCGNFTNNRVGGDVALTGADVSSAAGIVAHCAPAGGIANPATNPTLRPVTSTFGADVLVTPAVAAKAAVVANPFTIPPTPAAPAVAAVPGVYRHSTTLTASLALTLDHGVAGNPGTPAVNAVAAVPPANIPATAGTPAILAGSISAAVPAVPATLFSPFIPGVPAVPATTTAAVPPTLLILAGSITPAVTAVPAVPATTNVEGNQCVRTNTVIPCLVIVASLDQSVAFAVPAVNATAISVVGRVGTFNPATGLGICNPGSTTAPPSTCPAARLTGPAVTAVAANPAAIPPVAAVKARAAVTYPFIWGGAGFIPSNNDPALIGFIAGPGGAAGALGATAAAAGAAAGVAGATLAAAQATAAASLAASNAANAALTAANAAALANTGSAGLLAAALAATNASATATSASTLAATNAGIAVTAATAAAAAAAAAATTASASAAAAATAGAASAAAPGDPVLLAAANAAATLATSDAAASAAAAAALVTANANVVTTAAAAAAAATAATAAAAATAATNAANASAASALTAAASLAAANAAAKLALVAPADATLAAANALNTATPSAANNAAAAAAAAASVAAHDAAANAAADSAKASAAAAANPANAAVTAATAAAAAAIAKLNLDNAAVAAAATAAANAGAAATAAGAAFAAAVPAAAAAGAGLANGQNFTNLQLAVCDTPGNTPAANCKAGPVPAPAAFGGGPIGVSTTGQVGGVLVIGRGGGITPGARFLQANGVHYIASTPACASIGATTVIPANGFAAGIPALNICSQTQIQYTSIQILEDAPTTPAFLPGSGAPGTVGVLTGSSFEPRETVTIQRRNVNGQNVGAAVTTVTDGIGNLSFSFAAGDLDYPVVDVKVSVVDNAFGAVTNNFTVTFDSAGAVAFCKGTDTCNIGQLITVSVLPGNIEMNTDNPAVAIDPVDLSTIDITDPGTWYPESAPGAMGQVIIGDMRGGNAGFVVTGSVADLHGAAQASNVIPAVDVFVDDSIVCDVWADAGTGNDPLGVIAPGAGQAPQDNQGASALADGSQEFCTVTPDPTGRAAGMFQLDASLIVAGRPITAVDDYVGLLVLTVTGG